jgi:hypothetical protein
MTAKIVTRYADGPGAGLDAASRAGRSVDFGSDAVTTWLLGLPDGVAPVAGVTPSRWARVEAGGVATDLVAYEDDDDDLDDDDDAGDDDADFEEEGEGGAGDEDDDFLDDEEDDELDDDFDSDDEDEEEDDDL